MASLGKSIAADLGAGNFKLPPVGFGLMLRQTMEPIWQRAAVIQHSALLTRSYRRYTGRDLLPGLFNPPGLARHLFHAPFVVVSHGTEPDPLLNYGNQAALELWELTWEELTQMPSRLTAEAPEREERARLLAAVTARGFMDDYSGVRSSKSGRRFRIDRATVWNLITDRGEPAGQAATFERWQYL